MRTMLPRSCVRQAQRSRFALNMARSGRSNRPEFPTIMPRVPFNVSRYDARRHPPRCAGWTMDVAKGARSVCSIPFPRNEPVRCIWIALARSMSW
jgi:hypothetical protein